MTSTPVLQDENSEQLTNTWESATQKQQRHIVLTRGYDPAGRASLSEPLVGELNDSVREGPVAWTYLNYICTTLFGTCAFRGTNGCCKV